MSIIQDIVNSKKNLGSFFGINNGTYNKPFNKFNQPANTESIIPNSSYLNVLNNIQNYTTSPWAGASENKNFKIKNESKKSDNYFEDLYNKTFSPLQDLSQNSSANPFDVLGAFGNTALNILDVPFQLVGDGLDFAYDNTLGALTNTQDLFNGDNIRDVLNFGTMAIPGIGLGINGIKALKNLSNVSKFEKAMKFPYENALSNIVASNAAHVAKYGEDVGAKRAAKLLGQYTKKDKENNVPAPKTIKLDGLEKKGKEQPLDLDWNLAALEKMKTKSPTPVYRGGDPENGWFYTPDRRIAKDYVKYSDSKKGKERSLFEKILGELTGYRSDIQKLPAGTTIAPGRYYNTLSPGKKNKPGREVIINPKWLYR